MTKGVAVGIDLGTTNSCIGFYIEEDGYVEILANDESSRITPSYVAFNDEDEIQVGFPALYQIGTNPENTVYNIKRLMGRDFYEGNVQSDIKRFPFKVIKKNGRPYVQVKYKYEIKQFTAEEISSMILGKLKKMAEDYLDQTVTDAVITVPAYFNDTQRKATIDAGRIAGLNVLQIINEPTAAALAYGFKNKIKNKENILVVDLGGGTYDVSLLSIIDEKYEVKAVSGDTHLGGEDFTDCLVDYFIKEIKDNYGKNVYTDPKCNEIINRLRSECERTKKILTSKTVCNIEVINLFDGITFKSNITRARFEELNYESFKKLTIPIDDIINDSKLNKSDIKEIILVGGSTRIPKVQEIIKTYFNGHDLKKKINPDEAVAYGAAIQASILSKNPQSPNNAFLSDVTPLSLGICIKGGIMSTIVKRNTRIPTTRTESYITSEDYQTSVSIEIYEGERSFIKDNKLLDEFTLKGITPAPIGETKIKVTFDIDVNGVLRVSASEKGTSLYREITVDNKGRLYGDEIERMIRDANNNKEYDMKQLERKKALNGLEEYAYKLLKDLKKKRESVKRDILINAVDETIDWIKNNPNISKKESERRKAELELLSIPILSMK